MQQVLSLGVGCHWKGLFVGCLCYADDLALRAPYSAYALRRMLKICSEFAAERNLVFNAGWEDSIDMFLPTQNYCGWWLHWIFVGAFLIQLAARATFCHATYLIQLILKTNLFSVPTASSYTLECAPNPLPYSATYNSIQGQLTYWHVRLKADSYQCLGGWLHKTVGDLITSSTSVQS